MITIRSILAIPDDEESGFVPIQGAQTSNSSLESNTEHQEGAIQRRSIVNPLEDEPQPKLQSFTAKEIIPKPKETDEVKDAKEARPKLEDGGQATVDKLVEVELRGRRPQTHLLQCLAF